MALWHLACRPATLYLDTHETLLATRPSTLLNMLCQMCVIFCVVVSFTWLFSLHVYDTMKTANLQCCRFRVLVMCGRCTASPDFVMYVLDVQMRTGQIHVNRGGLSNWNRE